MKKNLLIDLGHLSHRYLFSQHNDIKVNGFGLLRHSLLKNGIISYIVKFNPDKVFIGVDKGVSWRKLQHSFYKENRADKREESDIDWHGFYKFMDEFVAELQEFLPFYTIVIPTMEADDIIGHLVRILPDDEEKFIVTSDSDYVQLLKYKNTKIHNPMKDAYVECEDPNRQLEIKILSGDKSDNIPGCRPRLGPKTAEKMIDSGELTALLESKDADGSPSEFVRNYNRNRHLIDMTNIPDSLQVALERYIKEYKRVGSENLFNYLVSRKLRDMLSNITQIRTSLEKLQPTPSSSVNILNSHPLLAQ